MQTLALAATELDALDDGTLVERARNRDGAAVRLIMQRHNRRHFRVARSVLNDDAEAEDVVRRLTCVPSPISTAFVVKHSSQPG
jgi:RNA polymerase sigma-70 factor (ECF subfamily)